jgi:hypothetical protein
MSSRTVVGLAAVLVVSSVSAQAQAAAEAALANAHSSAATAKAGSALGRAFNQGSSQLAGRIQQVAPAPVQVHRPQASRQLSTQAKAGSPTAATPTGSSLIVSVHGGAPPACAPTNQRVQEQAAASANSNCGTKTSPKAKPPTQYKSAITMSFPKQ